MTPVRPSWRRLDLRRQTCQLGVAPGYTSLAGGLPRRRSGTREHDGPGRGLTIYLPTYSPELNPIELWWADVKHRLRSLGINVRRALARAVRRLRASLPIDKITA